MTTTLDDYLDEYNSSSNTGSSNSSSGSDIQSDPRVKLSKSEQEQYEYENPIEAFRRRGMETSPNNHDRCDLDSRSGSDEEEGNLSARGLNSGQAIQNVEINVR